MSGLSASELGRPALAGATAALAYLAEQEIDRQAVNRRSNDLDLLGGLVTGHEWLWRPLGLAMHLSAGAAFGVVFDRVVAGRLPGPYWLRGVTMAQVENTALWPLIPILDRVHPAVKRGRLAPMHRRVYFAQAVLRHAALGAALGLLLDPRGRDR